MAAVGQEKEHTLTPLTAISPLDGRYWSRVEDLVPFTSEMALIQTRVEVEARYLVALSEAGIVRPLQDQERDILMSLGPNMTLEQTEEVKVIEQTTHHDVKAMERAFRGWLTGTSLADITEMIHFGLTSEDVNNLAHRLMLDRARKEVCIPALDMIVDGFVDLARKNRDIPMLARTHGQSAVPTTLGKEMANMAVRLHTQIRKLQEVKLTGKLNGAVGNFNAHALAAPEVDWIEFSNTFVRSLGLEPSLFTTQINPYDDMIEVFQALQRVNGILLDIAQDMWRYISDEWFVQDVRQGEVGSSTMPQKVNPIDFENAEGNVQMANSIWEGMCRKLAVSRLQRDLSDSTTVRNVGVGLGYVLVAYRSMLAGLDRVRPNTGRIHEALNENWMILSEGVQTVLRKTGAPDPYSTVASLSRGQKIGRDGWQAWVSGLQIDDDVRSVLMDLTPQMYIGYAAELTDTALEEIRKSREEARDDRN